MAERLPKKTREQLSDSYKAFRFLETQIMEEIAVMPAKYQARAQREFFEMTRKFWRYAEILAEHQVELFEEHFYFEVQEGEIDPSPYWVDEIPKHL